MHKEEIANEDLSEQQAVLEEVLEFSLVPQYNGCGSWAELGEAEHLEVHEVGHYVLWGTSSTACMATLSIWHTHCSGQCEKKDQDAKHAVCNMAGGTLIHKDVNSTGKQKDI